MPRLLGFRKFTSKAGNRTCVAVVACSPNQWELKNGFVGESAKTDLFVPEDCIDSFTESAIGKELNIIRDFDSYGKPYVKKIEIVSK